MRVFRKSSVKTTAKKAEKDRKKSMKAEQRKSKREKQCQKTPTPPALSMSAPATPNPVEEPAVTLLNTPAIKATGVMLRQGLFVQQLRLCRELFDFEVPGLDLEHKEAKRKVLLGMVDYINGAKGVLPEEVHEDVTGMLSANLFRDLDLEDMDEDEPRLEASWPHLQIVYEFLLRFVVSGDVDAKSAKKFISEKFILDLLELFNSEDPRERDYLKTILHRIYGKFMSLRAFIRASINNVFFRVVHENEHHNGIAELLEILGSIINGFAIPLKPEHKRFLVRALVPLHKVSIVGMYHSQLAYCVCQFVEHDAEMVHPVVNGLLRYWPTSNSPKQVLFLNELEDILELTQPSEFVKLIPTLFQQINECIGSNHFQVAERALFLWNNEYLISLIAQSRHQILPMLIKTLTTNADSHWNATVSSLTGNVLKLFQDMDPNFFNSCLQELENGGLVSQADVVEEREKRWIDELINYGR